MAWRYLTLTTLLIGSAALAQAPATPPPGALPEPFLPAAYTLSRPFFGDADNVRLLAGLLRDDDPVVRERAVRDLGRTGNFLALERLREAVKDDSPGVRATAVIAAEELAAPESPELVRQGLRDGEASVLVQAAGAAARTKLAGAGAELRALLDHRDGLVQEAALSAMTRASLSADADKLRGLLRHEYRPVRLRAAENAALLDKGDTLVDELKRLAAQDAPAVREAAVAALGKLAIADAAAVAAIEQARKDASPLVRRGALRAYTLARRTDRVRPFLDDASPLVLLAAVKSAGELKIADCGPRVLEVMLATGDDDLRRAAKLSLRQIGTPAVAEQAGAALRGLLPKLLAVYAGSGVGAPLRQHEIIEQNVAACCWLLGELKSKAGSESMLELFSKLPVSAEVLGEVAMAMAKFGDRQVVPAMAAMLQTCAENGQLALAAMLAGAPPPKPWNENVACALTEALATFNAPEGLPAMVSLATVKVSFARLQKAPAAVARVLPALVREDNRATIEKLILELLYDVAYSDATRFESLKVAGKLKLAAGRPAMEKMLTTERSSKLLIHAAAWALQELTGQTPALPEPKANQDDWIIRRNK